MMVGGDDAQNGGVVIQRPGGVGKAYVFHKPELAFADPAFRYAALMGVAAGGAVPAQGQLKHGALIIVPPGDLAHGHVRDGMRGHRVVMRDACRLHKAAGPILLEPGRFHLAPFDEGIRVAQAHGLPRKAGGHVFHLQDVRQAKVLDAEGMHAAGHALHKDDRLSKGVGLKAGKADLGQPVRNGEARRLFRAGGFHHGRGLPSVLNAVTGLFRKAAVVLVSITSGRTSPPISSATPRRVAMTRRSVSH